MTEDPCFSCPLADCDENSPRCNVRRLNRSYNAKLRRGDREAITEAERLAMNRNFEFWHLERAAEASEGGRPYRRGNRVFGNGGLTLCAN